MIIELIGVVLDFLATTRKGAGLLKVEELLKTAFGSATKERGYRVHVVPEDHKKSTVAAPKVVNYWCFNPGLGMANLTNQRVHSIITRESAHHQTVSGTL